MSKRKQSNDESSRNSKIPCKLSGQQVLHMISSESGDEDISDDEYDADELETETDTEPDDDEPGDTGELTLSASTM